ncbi:MAG: HAD hydrolase-like protein [Nanoarchaeota archaeon]
MIKTIIFDLNKVLVAYRNIEEEYQKTLGITQKIFWESGKEFSEEYTTGKTNLDYVLMNIMEKNRLDKNNLSEAKMLHEKTLVQMPGVDILLDSLKKNYSLMLAAGDGKESLEIKLKKFDLARHFNKIYATCYMGLMKTDINFYKEILHKSSLVPKEALFIDDKKDHLNIAKKLEINILLFEGLSKLKKNLKEEFSILF